MTEPPPLPALLGEIVTRLRERKAKGLPPLNLEASPLDQLGARIESMRFLLQQARDERGHVRSLLLDVVALAIETIDAYDAAHQGKDEHEHADAPLATETAAPARTPPTLWRTLVEEHREALDLLGEERPLGLVEGIKRLRLRLQQARDERDTARGAGAEPEHADVLHGRSRTGETG
jgi:hypothetical protein